MRAVLSFLAIVHVAAAAGFEPPRPLAAGTGPVAELIPADLDGDGDLDLVTVGRQSSVVTWYENAGRGGFRRAGFHEQTGPEALTGVADFDGDGLPDLLLESTTVKDGVWSVSARIVFGAGLAGFGPREQVLEPVANSDFGTGAMVHDIDGNGLPDLIYYYFVLLNPGGGDPVAMRTGAKGMHFAYEARASAQWLDVDGDGRRDAMTAELGCWWRNLGTGDFSDYLPLPVIGETGSHGFHVFHDPRLPGGRGFVALLSEWEGDLERRRLALFVEDVEDGSDGPHVEVDTVRLGEGNEGWLYPEFHAQEEAGPLLMSVKALREGVHPYLPAETNELRSITLRFRKGKPYLAMKTVLRPARPPGPVVRADMDGDGRRDLLLQAATEEGWLAAERGGNRIGWHRATVAGGFHRQPRAIEAPWQAERLETLVDLDADGDLDVITAGHAAAGSEAQVAVWQNRGKARSFSRRVLHSANDQARVVGVRQRGRRPELVVATVAWTASGQRDHRVHALVSTPGGGWRRKLLLASREAADHHWTHQQLGDWDGDGMVDLVVWAMVNGGAGDSGLPVRWAKGAANGTFGALLPLGQGSGETLHDVDGDGDPDLVPAGRNDAFSGRAGMWRENVGPDLLPVLRLFPELTAGIPPLLASAEADLDGDGRWDFLLDRRVPVFARANGALVAGPALPEGTTRFRDVDGDGDADAVTVTTPADPPGAAGWMWCENPGDGGFSPPQVLEGMTYGDPRFRELLAGDLDGDGTADLVTGVPDGRPRIEWFRGE